MTPQYQISLKEFYELFKTGGTKTQTMINTLFDARYNSVFWKKYFDKATMPLTINPDGTAMFQQIAMTTSADTMLKPRASFSEVDKITRDGFAMYQGSAAQYGLKQEWTSQELAGFAKIVEASGNNEAVFAAYMKETKKLVGGAHALISNLSAQLTSTGQYTSVNDRGFTTEGKAFIPTARFKTAGSVVWSNASADIIGKMQTEEKALRDATGYTGALSWKMDRTTFNYLMANTAIKNMMKDFVAFKVGMQTVSSLPAIVGTVETYNDWVGLLLVPYLSPIEIIEEEQVNETSQVLKTTVHGWKSQNVTLSPMGKQGEIQWAMVEEMKWMDTESVQLAYLEGGLFGIANYKVRQNEFYSLNTKILTHFAPALSVFDKMTIVDTLTAD